MQELTNMVYTHIAPYKLVLNNSWNDVTTPKRLKFDNLYVGIVHRDHRQKLLNALGQLLNDWLIGPQLNDKNHHLP
jgi:hypothetical protein